MQYENLDSYLTDEIHRPVGSDWFYSFILDDVSHIVE